VGGRTGDSGCSLDAEEGNVASSRQQSTGTRREVYKNNRSRQGTRPSLGPEARTRQSLLYCAGVTRRRWRVRSGIAVGQTHASGSNRHRGQVERTQCGSPRAYRFRKEGRVARQKRKGVAASVPARIPRVPVAVPARRKKYVAEIDRCRLVSNTLTRSAPKRVAAGVNGDLARGNRRP